MHTIILIAKISFFFFFCYARFYSGLFSRGTRAYGDARDIVLWYKWASLRRVKFSPQEPNGLTCAQRV